MQPVGGDFLVLGECPVQLCQCAADDGQLAAGEPQRLRFGRRGQQIPGAHQVGDGLQADVGAVGPGLDDGEGLGGAEIVLLGVAQLQQRRMMSFDLS